MELPVSALLNPNTDDASTSTLDDGRLPTTTVQCTRVAVATTATQTGEEGGMGDRGEI
jgi:hypothetical protein